MSKTETAAATETVEKKTAREVLFFELETFATTGRSAMFDALQKTMKSKELEVTKALFAKCGLTARPGAAIQCMINDSGRNLTTGDQLAEQAETAMKKFFADEAELNKALPALIKAAQEKNIEVVALSPWGEELAAALMKKLGLDEMGVGLVAQDCQEAIFPRADHWLRFLKQRGQDEIPVIALVTSAGACRGAMTAGATVVAIPDEYSAFEDFSGAKIILDSLDEMKPAELLDLVSRR
jgi:beta-phosphoglucomutase-like phosphatase (HAD superfamily)